MITADFSLLVYIFNYFLGRLFFEILKYKVGHPFEIMLNYLLNISKTSPPEK